MSSRASEIPVCDGIAPLIGAYDGVILDLWGVVHDGRTPYPGAIDTLGALKDAGKKVVMLSNAPRRAAAVIDGMTGMGIQRELYTDVLSSGELSWRKLKTRDDDWMRALGARCLHLGPDRDRGIFDGLDLDLVDGPEAGAFILNTGPWRDEEKVSDYEELLQDAARHGMPMICANPDLEVIRGGVRIICAGALAARYRDIGGEVRTFGKPYPESYDACLDLMGISEKSRLVAIGDSFATDIRGANAAGVDAVFVTSGIHGAELGLSYGERPDAARLAEVCAREGVTLRAAIPALLW